MASKHHDKDMTNPKALSDVAPKPYLAHVRRNEDGSFKVHDLEEHLRAVGDLVAEFASRFGCSD